jgi:hypothetical protein
LKEDTANKSTDVTLADATNVKFPTELAVKTFVTAANATNANLTGVVTSTGNATAIADAALSIAMTNGLQNAIDSKVADVINDGTTIVAPSQNAVFDALATKESTANKSINVTLDGSSDVKFPSVKSVKTYVDTYSTINAISTVTANYTALITDYTILSNNSSGNFTLTLPNAADATGKVYVIRKVDETTNLLNFSPGLKLTESTMISSINFPKTIRIQSNGSSWYVID